MEKIQLSEDIIIYKIKLNLKKFKDDFLYRCYKEIKNQPHAKKDAFNYEYHPKHKLTNNFWGQKSFSKEILLTNKLDVVVQNGINFSEKIYKTNGNNWNIVNSISWFNRTRSVEPIQYNFNQKTRNDKYHTHTETAKQVDSFYPHYTWVYYIQMPNVIRENTDDAVLYFKSKDDSEYFILPEEDDLIIIPGDIPHLPMHAPAATNDRIVLAGDVGFEMIKNKKTLF